jgi:ribosomal protein S18 acetylase RimI-like enzyme
LKIRELEPGAKPDVLAAILEPFNIDEDCRDAALGNFREEISEIGDNRIILVGEIAGNPAATGQLVLKNADNDPELADGRRIAHVHRLWVRKDLQRRGLAKAMMRRLEEKAGALGYQTLTVGVDDYNTAAIALYRALGYAEFKREEGRSHGEQLLLMRKMLGAPSVSDGARP